MTHQHRVYKPPSTRNVKYGSGVGVRDSNFLSATGLLSGSVKRFSTMLRSSRDNRRIMCYVSGGLVLLFCLLYFLLTHLQR
ncbi:hypothetical protein CRUP_018786 [Coryphaenoides rupestris]|nr:hypothetical protein CRUP_018786 [Coryphaenoides rupestris]